MEKERKDDCRKDSREDLPFNVSETQSQRNESLIVEFVVANAGAAG